MQETNSWKEDECNICKLNQHNFQLLFECLLLKRENKLVNLKEYTFKLIRHVLVHNKIRVHKLQMRHEKKNKTHQQLLSLKKARTEVDKDFIFFKIFFFCSVNEIV